MSDKENPFERGDGMTPGMGDNPFKQASEQEEDEDQRAAGSIRKPGFGSNPFKEEDG